MTVDCHGNTSSDNITKDTKFCKNCVYFKKGFALDYCNHSVRSVTNIIDGKTEVFPKALPYYRTEYCGVEQPQFFKPYPLRIPIVSKSTFFQKVKKFIDSVVKSLIA